MNHLFLLLFGAVTFVAHAQVPDYVPTEGLVGWYPFNGNANDESGNGNDGVAENIEFTIGHFGNELSAIDLDGVSSYVDLDLPSVSNQFEEVSLNLWVQTLDESGPMVSLRDFNGWHSLIFAVGTLSNISIQPEYFGSFVRDVCCGSGNTLFGSHVADGLWHMLTFVRENDGVVTLFKNSDVVAVSSSSNGGLLEFSGGYLSIGSDQYWDVSASNGNCGSCNTPDERYLEGKIDDLGIWNRALTEDEITALYNAVLPVLGCTDPTACNYNPTATDDDGTCIAPTCDDPSACNYDPGAICGGGECIPSGCMEPLACNYNALAECTGEACDYTCCPGPGCCADGTSWDYGLGQCVPDDANDATTNSCPQDLDFDGVVGVGDLMDLLSVFGTDCPDSWTCGDPVSYQGYDYATVQIGGQCWFAENLRSELYQNGDTVPSITDIDAWNATLEGATVVYGEGNAQCLGNCDVPLNLANSGRLYNYYAAADERNLCPASWHVPNIDEWQMLSDTLGGDTVSGPSLKSSALDAPAWNGTNESAFSAVTGGLRAWSGHYAYNDNRAYFWSNVQQGCCGAKARMLESESSSFLEVANVARRAGLSIRCLKDE